VVDPAVWVLVLDKGQRAPATDELAEAAGDQTLLVTTGWDVQRSCDGKHFGVHLTTTSTR
jgi:hypothetical protein